MTKLLELKGLKTQFHTEEGVIHAVNGVSLSLNNGETLGIVGESGCGKSVTMTSLLRLIPMPPGRIVAGEAFFNGKDLLKVSDSEIRSVRGSQIGMIFQDPMTFFNPVIPIGRQVSEPLEIHRGVPRKEALERAAEMLNLVGIPSAKDRLDDYPHQFSGGMRQRAMIAMSLVCSPQLLIADEPTTALDVTIQAQIVELVLRLREKLGMTIIWITHDLGVVAGLAERVAVMYAGFIIEESTIDELYAHPQHPYTIGLLGSLPRLDDNGRKRLVSIDGLPPVLTKEPTACPFADRCWLVKDKCRTENPLLINLNDHHKVACWVDVETGRIRS